MGWKTSNYTHAIGLESGEGVLYNGRSGALVKLSPGAFERARSLFETAPRGTPLPAEAEAESLFPHLVAGEFVIDEGFDELAFLEERYHSSRAESQFLITILPTFGCNLGCDYCFVGKKVGMMSRERQDQVIEEVARHLEGHTVPSMMVDWFGGEPLLALPVIEYLSRAFLGLCEQHGIPYGSQVITNGTVITEEAIRVLESSGVERLQITLDGQGEMHDRRRPYKAGSHSSYEDTLDGIAKAVGRFLIRLRVNVDRENLHEVWSLVDLFEERGWLGEDTRFFPYLARISPFTEACSAVSEQVCSMEEFQEVQLRWMKRLHEAGVPVSYQGLYQFPQPKLYNCGAVGNNGFIFNPNGEIHKCGLAVDDSSEAVGHLGEGIDTEGANSRKWREYTPFHNEVCRGCEYLPSCLGGCPRNQMESREVQKKENCTYYQQHENEILATHLTL